MEFGNKNPKDCKIKASLNETDGRMNSLRSIFKSAVESQVFFNSRLKAIEYIEKIGDISTAMLTMTIEKKRGILVTDYEVRFSLLYSHNDGRVFKTENFYTVTLPGKEGMIPDYILKIIDQEGSLEVKFNSEDLSIIYDERKEKIDEDSTFEEVLTLCKGQNVAAIRLIDRVFYTRIECFNSSAENTGCINVGMLQKVPTDILEKLYPGGNVIYKLA